MGKKMKMKMPSIFRNRDALIHWPSCTHPNTPSFRGLPDDVIFKTVNSVFFDNLETPDSLFTSSSQSRSFSSESDSTAPAHQSVEAIIRGVVRSDRLFFNPGHTSSILEPNTKANAKAIQEQQQQEDEEEKLPFKESVALAMESDDPYADFKKSMEEMVESHGLKDWECLEELLGWYLKMNGKMNHGYIVGAFVDLLVGLGSSPSTSTSHESTSFSSAASSFASPLSSSCNNIQEEEENTNITCSN